tara:strand:- start:937 stop:1185 length:249 start_codon:yes stop_codon:yes gene_type:complete
MPLQVFTSAEVKAMSKEEKSQYTKYQLYYESRVRARKKFMQKEDSYQKQLDYQKRRYNNDAEHREAKLAYGRQYKKKSNEQL